MARGGPLSAAEERLVVCFDGTEREHLLMTRFRVLAIGMALLSSIACSDDDPVHPSATAPTFVTQMLPGNEVPPVTNADSSASGNASVVVQVTRDSNQAITAATATFTVVMSGFPANTSLTGSHIHNGRVGQNSGIVVDTGIRLGDIVLPTGTARFERTVSVTPVVAQNMLNDPAGFYFNVHTTLTPSGAIRGQLSRIQ